MTTRRPSFRVHRELDVAAAGVDADLAQNRDREVAHRLVFAVGESHRRCDGDRVAGVDADRSTFSIEQTITTLSRPSRISSSSYSFHPRMTPRSGRSRWATRPDRRRRCARGSTLVVRHAGTEATHRERRAHDHRVTELGDGGLDLFHRGADPGARGLAAALLDDVLELLTVLAALDRVEVGADQLDVVLLQNALLVQRDRGVEGGLPPSVARTASILLPCRLTGDDLLDELA